MAINFPSTPSDGQLHTENSISYRYNSSVGAWLIVPASIPNVQGTADQQVIFNNQGSSNGSNGLTFSITANTLYTHNVAVTANVSATYFLGNGALLTGVVSDFSPAFNKANDSYSLAQTAFDRANTSNDVLFIVGAYDSANAAFDKANAANLLAYGTGIGANAYTVSVGTAGNNFAGVMANAANAYAASLTPDLSPVYIYANNLGSAGNANLSVATISANAFASSVGSSGNTYAEAIGTAGNTYASAVGTAANANLSVATISANNWANTKLSNTSGVMFEGTLNIKTNLSVGNNITTSNTLTFSTASTFAVGEGQVTWNPDESTLDVGLANSSILQVGQEILYRVKNQTGSTITEGTVVMAAGTLGASGRILVTPAISNGTYPSKYLMGIATSTIVDGGDGYVTHFGKVRGIDTSMWSEGDILYANVSVPGALQNTAPTAPNTKTTVAIVVSKHASTGTLFVRPTYGSKLNEDELVELTSLTNGDVLVYNSTPGRFENKVQLALNAGSVDGLTANTIIESSNGYSRVFANSVGTAANANLSVGTVAANSYSASVGLSVNANLSVATVSANNFAGTMANASNAYASATYFLKTGGTISGDIVITGNATISGLTTYANTQTLLIGDNILTLNADIPNNVAPSEDAGIEVNRGNKNSNAAIIWNETACSWMFTSNTQVNYTKAIASNTDVDSAGAKANAYTDTVVIANVNIANAYSRVFANSVGTSGNAYTDTVVVANLAIANAYSRTFANSVGTAGNTYTDTVVLSNVAIANAYSRVFANTKVSSVSGTSGRITSSGGTTPTIDLATSGVTAAVYGNASIIPVITVDAYGRVTAVTNTAVSASGGAGGVTVNNESSSSSTYYPLFTTNTTGSVAYANVSNTGLYFVPSTGTLSATIFNSLSDITLKTDIEGFDGVVLLEDVNPVSFIWKQTGSKSYGVIAQELEKVLPELVETNDNGLKSVSYIPMIAMLIDAVKKQEERITKLEQLLNAK